MNEYLRRYIKAVTPKEKINAGFLLTQSYGFHLESDNGGFRFFLREGDLVLNFWPSAYKLEITIAGKSNIYVGPVSVNKAFASLKERHSTSNNEEKSLTDVVKELENLKERVKVLESIAARSSIALI